MTRLIPVLILSAALAFAQSGNDFISFGPVPAAVGLVAATNARTTGNNHRLAYKIVPPPGSIVVSAVDLNVAVSGSMAGINIVLEIYGHSPATNSPAGPVLAATAAFAAPSSSGFTGAQNLTGAFALNTGTTYWLVLRRDVSSTADFTAGNYLTARYVNNGNSFGGSVAYSSDGGANWSVDVDGADGAFVFRTSSGAYWGHGMTAGPFANPLLFGTTRYVVQFQYPYPVSVAGMYAQITRGSAAVDDLEMRFVAGAIDSTTTIPRENVATSRWGVYYFNAPRICPADTACYIVLHQAGDGGTGSNYYGVYTETFATAEYLATRYPSTWKFRIGANSAPGSNDVVYAVPRIWPIISSVSAIQAAGSSGGSYTFH